MNLNIVIAAPGGYVAASGDRTQIVGNNITTGSETGLWVSGSYCNITDNTSGGRINLEGSSNTIVRNSFSTIFLSGDSNKITNNTFWSVHLSNANKNVISGNNIGILMRDDTGIYIEGNSSHNVFYANDVGGYLYDVEMEAVNSKSENNTFYHITS